MCLHSLNPINVITAWPWLVLQAGGTVLFAHLAAATIIPQLYVASRGMCLASRPTLVYYSLEVSVRKKCHDCSV